jgi:DNA primase
VPFITRQSIEDVRMQADIVALIGDYTTLKQSGTSWKGLSPFASEKTPSFYVHPDKGFFHCFSTNQGGDIFRFLMIKEGLNFQESAERIAARFGIQLQYEQGGATQEDRTLRTQLFNIHEAAAGLYADALKAATPDAATVRTYWLENRRFTLETAGQFQIGFAPVDGGGLARALLKKGYTKDALAKSGLFVGMDFSPDPLRWRARFRGRLMIPIRDIQGRIVAFTARKLDLTPTNDPSHEAKYINSPDTEIFHKSQLLFNLDKARVAAKGDTPFVLVEGQLDAIRAYTCGVTTAVASQGTAIGAEHMALLRRFTRNVHALLDADRAGQAAALKLLPLAFHAGMDVQILSVPGGKDPDEYLAATGADGWAAVRDSATGAIPYAVRSLLPSGEVRTTAQKLDALQALFAIIAQAESAIARDDALGEVSRLAALDPIAVRRDFLRFQKSQHTRQPRTDGTDAEIPAANASPLTSVEYSLLSLILHHIGFAGPLATIVQPEWLDTTKPAGAFLDRILAEVLHGDWQDTLAAQIAQKLAENDAEQNLLSQLLVSPSVIPDPRAYANECLAALFKRFLKKRRAAIATQLAAAPPDANVTPLQREEINLRKTLQHLPQLP